MPEPLPVFVHLLPALIPPGALKGGVALVLDVLRATTAMVQALESGVEAILPCLEIDEARALAASLGPGRAILGGERQGLPIEGFDLGNSPSAYTPEVCKGKTLVMTTTNGTRAIHASLEADGVLIAAFSNAMNTIGRAYSADRPIHIVCAGTDGRISLEDTLLAGCLVDAFRIAGCEPGNDEARIACGFWADSEVRIEIDTPLAEILAEGRGGRRVREIGLGDDMDAAAARDEIDLVAELQRDPLRIVRL